MSSTVATSNERWANARVAALCGIVALSLLLPGAWIAYAINSARSSKPFGQRSSETRYFLGGLKDAELWFPTIRRRRAGPSDLTTVDIRRLNLDSGAQSETGISLDRAYLPVWIGETLYLYSPIDILQVDGTELVSLGSPSDDPLLGPPFEYEGQLTVVTEAEQRVFRLQHWRDGQWHAGQRILLPGPDRVWVDDPQQFRKTLLPLACAQPKHTGSRVDFRLDVVSESPDFHLLVTARQPNFAAYRKGFEFIDESVTDGASAVAPANDLREVFGWEQVDVDANDDLWAQMVCDHNGLLFQAVRNSTPRIVWRNPDGHCEQLSGQHEAATRRPDLHDAFVAANPADPSAYVIRSNEWGSASISKVDGNVVRPAHAFVSGSENEYLERWQQFARNVAGAWLFHWIILFCGACWLTRRGGNPELSINSELLAPAGLWRRTTAGTIDLCVWLGIFIVIGRVCFGSLLNRIKWPSGPRVAEALFRLETSISNAIDGTGVAGETTTASLVQPIQTFLDTTLPDRELIQFLIVLLLIPYALKMAIESRFGFTIGKWLLGLRTVRIDGSRCGVLRLVVRDVTNCCELSLLTPLVTVSSMILSPRYSRLGDRLARTMGIRPSRPDELNRPPISIANK